MKKILLPLMPILLFISCKKDRTNCSNKISICHRTSSDVTHGKAWVTIEININALPAHLSHGDVVPDADGDSYTNVNPCGTGTQNDCDDNNASIHENCGIASVTICNQMWMVKNLDVSKYRNGDDIPQVTDPIVWLSLTTGAWCWYNNDSATFSVYGKLYNWYAVTDSRGLAPADWHVPSDDEWTTLTDCLGGESVAAGKMKETGTSHWQSPNAAADNSSGFAALPGGTHNNDGSFYGIGDGGYWWSSTELNAINSWYRYLNYAYAIVFRNDANKTYGFSVRCVRD